MTVASPAARTVEPANRPGSPGGSLVCVMQPYRGFRWRHSDLLRPLRAGCCLVGRGIALWNIDRALSAAGKAICRVRDRPMHCRLPWLACIDRSCPDPDRVPAGGL